MLPAVCGIKLKIVQLTGNGGAQTYAHAESGAIPEFRILQRLVKGNKSKAERALSLEMIFGRNRPSFEYGTCELGAEQRNSACVPVALIKGYEGLGKTLTGSRDSPHSCYENRVIHESRGTCISDAKNITLGKTFGCG
jgi:hypothetical protein